MKNGNYRGEDKAIFGAELVTDNYTRATKRAITVQVDIIGEAANEIAEQSTNLGHVIKYTNHDLLVPVTKTSC